MAPHLLQREVTKRRTKGIAVPHSSRATNPAPQAAKQPQSSGDRDTLQSIDSIFLHDQLQALLASPTLARVAARHADDGRDQADSDDSVYERDTEPSLDTQALRDALEAGLK